MARYTTVKKTALRLNLSERRIQALCHDGRIDGALMLGGAWLIPDDAKKPDSIRESTATGFAGQLSIFDFITGESLFDLDTACDFLGISRATGTNWIKAHRLAPSLYDNGKPMFTLDSLRILLAQISMDDGNSLKSRRNKSQINGIASYSDYLSDSDTCKDAAELIRQMVSLAKNEPDIDSLIPLILAEYAIQFLMETGRIDSKTSRGIRVSKPAICAYFKGELSLGIYEPFIEDFFLTNVALSGEAPAILQEMMTFHLPHIPGQDVLGLLYISLKSLKDRKATGTYYTPNRLVNELLEQSLVDTDTSLPATVLDPCCGTGNFLLALLKHGVYPNAIYAQDNDELSVSIARINMILNSEDVYLDTIRQQISCQDTLFTEPSLPTFDMILGNPPWGSSFDRETTKRIQSTYQSAGVSIESFRLFIEYALKHLTEDGMLAYVLPESFLLVQSHEQIRKMMIASAELSSVTFEPNGFKNVQCPAILLAAKHRKETDAFTDELCHPIHIQTPEKAFYIHKNRHLETEDFWNLQIDDKEYALLSSIDSLKGALHLTAGVDYALGIVTGNNALYLIPFAEYEAHPEHYPLAEPVLKGSEVYRFGHAMAENYIVFSPEDFQQTAKEAFYRAKEKLIYRFISNRPVFSYDNQQTLTLNSANLLIPNIPMLSVPYLLGILNSHVASYYLSQKFHSVKLLRSHIESLPIPRANGAQQKNVVDIVHKLMVCNSIDDAKALYQELNQMIYWLYELDSDQIHLIETSLDLDKEASLLYSAAFDSL